MNESFFKINKYKDYNIFDYVNTHNYIICIYVLEFILSGGLKEVFSRMDISTYICMYSYLKNYSK